MRILVFGDSIVNGRCDEEYFGWANRLAVYAQQESNRTDWEKSDLVFNLGICGQTSGEVLARFKSEASVRAINKNTLVIFAVGINDATHRGEVTNVDTLLPQFRKNIEKLITEAKSLPAQVVVVGLTRVVESKVNPYLDSSTGKSWVNQNIEQYDEMLKEVANDNGITYVPTDDLIKESMLEDGLHPDAAGHQLIFERVKETLEEKGII